jgi:2-C-methyl-D-erythritol 4-phosphate cytidylyltransferase
LERQDSVQSGLNTLISRNPNLEYVAIHDSARPLLTIPEILSVTSDAMEYGAAVLGVPCKATKRQPNNLMQETTINLQIY